MDARNMAAWWLRRAADEFGNHGCNDLDDDFIKEANLSDAEKVEFVKQFVLWNGDQDEIASIEPIEPRDFDRLPDFALMGFLADRIKRDEWVTITDDPGTLPEPGTKVLVSWNSGLFAGWVREGMYLNEAEKKWSGFTPTHWQRLPSIPKADSSGKEYHKGDDRA
jgi:diadenosine tetraphosphatase ApaH/serine/threonine PP2A family protein phosphatase